MKFLTYILILLTAVALCGCATTAFSASAGAAAPVGDGNVVTIPFKLVDNRIYIQATVNGHPLTFAVDTGTVGSNALTPQAALTAGIVGQGHMQAGGFGSKRIKYSTAKIRSFVLNHEVSFRDQLFNIVPIPVTKAGGTTVAGTVGYDLFKRFVVKIDYAHKTLILTRLGNFDASNAGTRIPINVASHIPAVMGSIDGLPGVFLIDTGNAAPLMLTSPFASSHDLYTRYRTTPVFETGPAFRVKMSLQAARGGELKLGGAIVHDPVIVLSEPTNKGVLSSKAFAGIVGGEVLRRFTVTFDYANNNMYLKPNGNYGAPMHFTRSGILAKPGEKGLVAGAVIKGSPAAQAGIKAGDIITKLNGKSTADIGLGEFEHVLRNKAPGTNVRLTFEDDGHSRTATIALRRLIPETGGLQPASSSPNS